ncbi:hypothetical protein [Halorientalis marina]|jgi:hypothetical protein|nr:hypothetical protein [Halorientalis marina]
MTNRWASSEKLADLLTDGDEGMTLHPRVYTQVEKKLRELGE